MTVANGQPADETTFNSSFMSREADTSTVGVVALQNTINPNSGAVIANAQRYINEIAAAAGVSGEGDATANVYSSNNVVTDGDDYKTAIGKLDDATASANGLYGVDQEATLDSASGTFSDVTFIFNTFTPGGDASNAGVVTTAPNNYCNIVEKDTYREVEDGSGRRVYGRLTEAALTWTISYYVNIAGVETAHNLSTQDIRFSYIEVFTAATRPTFSANLGRFDSIAAVEDIPEATATQPGKVSIGAQTFGGIKEFQSNPTTGGSDILSTDNTKVVTNKDIDGLTASNTSRITLPKNTTTNLNALTRKEGTLVYDTDTQTVKYDDGAALVEVGSGGGGGSSSGGSLDIFYQDNFETTQASDFTTGNSATPFDSGTLQGTLSNETSLQLKDTRSIKFVQAAGSLNDWFHLPALIIEPKEMGKQFELVFNTSYTGADGDIEFVLYDDTNAAEIGRAVVKTGSYERQSISFLFDETTASLTVGAQVAVENIGATLIFDDLELRINRNSPGEIVVGGGGGGGSGNLLTNPTFDTDVSGWGSSPGGAVTHNAIDQRLVLTASGNYPFAYQSFATTIGEPYIATATGRNNTASGSQNYLAYQVGSSSGSLGPTLVGAVDASAGPHIISDSFVATETTMEIQMIGATSGTWVQEWDNMAAAHYTDIAVTNFVTNATFDTDVSGWTAQSGTMTWNAGRLRIVGGVVYQLVSGLNIGQKYLAQVTGYNIDLSSNSNPVLYVAPGSNVNTVISILVGSSISDPQVLTIEFTATETSHHIVLQRNSGAGICEFDNAIISDGTLTGGGGGGSTIPGVIGTDTVIIQESYADNTSPQTGTTTTWNTRALTKIRGNLGFCSISSNQATLDQGTYSIEVCGQSAGSDGHQLRLRNITDSTTTLIGDNAYSDTASYSTSARMSGVFRIDSPKTFEIQHYQQVGADFGVIVNSGEEEIYLTAKITKED